MFGSLRLVLISLIAGWTIWRLIYLIWLCPWDLLGDEAYYWVQGQHLSLSYSEKGPLLPWLCWLSNKWFGAHEWSVRLPVMIASTFACSAIALVTHETYRRWTTTLLAALVFLLVPAFQANSQICTQDGILIFIFSLAAWLGARAFTNGEPDRTWLWRAAFYACIGIGVLTKQSTVLFLIAVPTYALLAKPRPCIDLKWIAHQVLGLAIIFVICTPIFIWESTHGWPMLHHTMGHLGLDDSAFASRKSGNALVWSAGTAGALIGTCGPAFIAMLAGTVAVLRSPDQDSRTYRNELWLICTAWPTIAFYQILSLTKPVVASWPLPSLVTLVPIAASFLDWPGNQPSHRGPASSRRWLVPATIVYGSISLVLLSFPGILGHAPFFGRMFATKVESRFSGQAAKANRVAAELDAHPSIQFVVAPNYPKASLLSFYLNRKIAITSAGNYVGDRLSNYDQWPETSLTNPRFLGQNALLYAGDEQSWSSALRFREVIPLDVDMFLGRGYQGVVEKRAGQRREQHASD